MADRRSLISGETRDDISLTEDITSSGHAGTTASLDDEDGAHQSATSCNSAATASIGLEASRYPHKEALKVDPFPRATTPPPPGNGGHRNIANRSPPGSRGRAVSSLRSAKQGASRGFPSHSPRRTDLHEIIQAARRREFSGVAAGANLSDRTNMTSKPAPNSMSESEDPDSKYLSLRPDDFIGASRLPMLVNDPAPWQLPASATKSRFAARKSAQSQHLREVQSHQPQQAVSDPESSAQHAQPLAADPYTSRQRRPMWKQYNIDQASSSSVTKDNLGDQSNKHELDNKVNTQLGPERFAPVSREEKMAFKERFENWAHFALDIGEYHHGLPNHLIEQIGRAGCLNRSWPPPIANRDQKASLSDLTMIDKEGRLSGDMLHSIDNATLRLESSMKEEATEAHPSSPIKQSGLLSKGIGKPQIGLASSKYAPSVSSTKHPETTTQLQSDQLSISVGHPQSGLASSHYSSLDVPSHDAFTEDQSGNSPAHDEQSRSGLVSSRSAAGDIPSLGASTTPTSQLRYMTTGKSIHAPRVISVKKTLTGSPPAADMIIDRTESVNAKMSRAEATATRQEQNRRRFASTQAKSGAFVPGTTRHIRAPSQDLRGLQVARPVRQDGLSSGRSAIANVNLAQDSSGEIHALAPTRLMRGSPAMASFVFGGGVNSGEISSDSASEFRDSVESFQFASELEDSFEVRASISRSQVGEDASPSASGVQEGEESSSAASPRISWPRIEDPAFWEPPIDDSESSQSITPRNSWFRVDEFAFEESSNDPNESSLSASPRINWPRVDDPLFWTRPVEDGEFAAVDEYGLPKGIAHYSFPTSLNNVQGEDTKTYERKVSTITFIDGPQISENASATSSTGKKISGRSLGQPSREMSVGFHLPTSIAGGTSETASQNTPHHDIGPQVTSPRASRHFTSALRPRSSSTSGLSSKPALPPSTTPSTSSQASSSRFFTPRSSERPHQLQRRLRRAPTYPPIAESSYLGGLLPNSQPLQTISEREMLDPKPNFPPGAVLGLDFPTTRSSKTPLMPSHNQAISINPNDFPNHRHKPCLPKDFPLDFVLTEGTLISPLNESAFEQGDGRTIFFFNLPIGYTAAEVVSLVWGGPLESVIVEPGCNWAAVKFMYIGDCDDYAASLPKNGLQFPGHPERIVKYMRRMERDDYYGNTAAWIQAGATRCLRIISIPGEVTVANILHLLMGRIKSGKTFERPLEWLLMRSAQDLSSHALHDFCREGTFPLEEQWMVSVRFTRFRHALDVIWLIHCVPEWLDVLERGYIQTDWLEDTTATSAPHPRTPGYFGRHEKVFPVPAIYGYTPRNFDFGIATEVCDIKQEENDDELKWTAEDIATVGPVWPGDFRGQGKRCLMHGYVTRTNMRDPGYVGIEDQVPPKSSAEGLARGRGASV